MRVKFQEKIAWIIGFVSLLSIVFFGLAGKTQAAAPCAYFSDPKYVTGAAGCAADCNTFYSAYKCTTGLACLQENGKYPDLECPTGQSCCFAGEVAPKAPETTTPAAAGGSGATPPATSLDTSGCKVPGTEFTFPCPLGERGVNQIIGNLIKWVLGVVGGLFLVMFVYGGFQYIISGANSKSAELGQKTLINAVIGITIVIGAYILVDALAKLFKLGLA